ncbi:amidase [Ancylobacter mangrovi]|uniref:amidase n=1 Tax=Ancylobacter mangrovi TaxID=2972472 RepID=UPI002162DBE6|nr:amidase family protein [Ancylobacter mangrovi]MCS0505002.1 amidase family protein [Ancylobacter mangrovi]
MLELSARETRALIGRKQLSPVEVHDACQARIEAVDPHLNALVARDFERSRRDARRAEDAVMRGEQLGVLHGLPVAIKDLTETEGLVTSFGSLAHADNVPWRDDPLVARIRAAGGVVIAKSNTPEFGAGANTVNKVYGATVNPFDPTLSCAGSSGGSAAALAPAMVPLATGSDLGGSLRTPASFCGVVGHRPSPGAVASEGRAHGWSPHLVEGPMARCVDDAALLMAAMVGESARDPLSRPLDPRDFLHLHKVDPGTLRVAFSADLGGVPVAREVAEHFVAVAEGLAPLFGHSMWKDPELPEVDATFETLRAVGFAGGITDYVERHRALATPNVVANTELARRFAIADIARAQAGQTEILRRFQDFFADVDLLICPAASVVPFPVDELYVPEINGVALDTYISWCAIAYAITLTSHPATVIPCGLGPSGLPFGLQIVGRLRDDAGTLAAAAAIEAALADDPVLARPAPDLTRLARMPSRAGAVIAALAGPFERPGAHARHAVAP